MPIKTYTFFNVDASVTIEPFENKERRIIVSVRNNTTKNSSRLAAVELTPSEALALADELRRLSESIAVRTELPF